MRGRSEEAEMEKKGTVTPLSSLYPVEDVKKASILVQHNITERSKQLEQIKGFINDNTQLINLVRKLPDEISHHIMVPFGKAAFFPGRLIHTNEFMVLLGEGYYAERTAKQTVEIFKRRGQALETQVESLKAIMQDLKAENSFFDATAHESAEGLVDIREDYTEESSCDRFCAAGHGSSDSAPFVKEDGRKIGTDDEEYNRILSRFDELEKEEEEAEKSNEYKVNGQQIENGLDTSISQQSIDLLRSSQVEDSMVPASAKDLDGSLLGKPYSFNENNMDKNSEVPEPKERVQSRVTGSGMAFTGSIVEHTTDNEKNWTALKTGAQSSKPVSRFRLQRK